ncbi:MAG: helix-turn-helix domain-containing protein [Sciscionella sp.]
MPEPTAARPPDNCFPQVPAPRRPVFYTAAETSKIVRLDESTLYRHLRNGTFPGIKIGGRYVVPQVVLELLISDVLATGRCVDLAEWTERWRSEQDLTAQRLATGQHSAATVSDRNPATAAVRLP